MLISLKLYRFSFELFPQASYACLDPTNPMTLSVDPLHDYCNEADVFTNPCDLSLYERQSYSTLPSTFRPSLDDRGIYPESPKMWSKMSKPLGSFNDVDNTSKTLEERLRKAYARSRISQFTQQGQWNDNASRLSVQRPVVKTNVVPDASNDDSQSYSFQRGFIDSGSRRMPSLAVHNVSTPDRWNRLVSCPDSLNPNGSDCLIASSPCLRDEEGANFVPLQSSTVLDQSSGKVGE